MEVVDMHCDTISEIYKRIIKGEQVDLRSNNMHADLLRMEEGDYLLQNFALFLYLKGWSDPFRGACELLDIYEEQILGNQDKIAKVLCFEDIEKNKKAGKLSAMLTIEEGAVCQGSLEKLHFFYDKGVRMMTLTWNFPNELGFPNVDLAAWQEKGGKGAPDFHKPDTKRGLTKTGFAFVEEMEKMGMIVDVSHGSDALFYDVARTLKGPFVASHSNARAVCPNVRNLTDDMIRTLADKGGVTGLNFCPDFLRDETGYQGDLESIVAHAKHIVNVGGEDCLGLGSDFDGIDGHKELPGVESMPLLADAFIKCGFSNRQVEKIFSENVLRVYKEILK